MHYNFNQIFVILINSFIYYCTHSNGTAYIKEKNKMINVQQTTHKQPPMLHTQMMKSKTKHISLISHIDNLTFTYFRVVSSHMYTTPSRS